MVTSNFVPKTETLFSRTSRANSTVEVICSGLSPEPSRCLIDLLPHSVPFASESDERTADRSLGDKENLRRKSPMRKESKSRNNRMIVMVKIMESMVMWFVVANQYHGSDTMYVNLPICMRKVFTETAREA